MPFELSLVDLVSPYVLQGDTFGSWHAMLGALRVAEHEVAADENGVTIRGTVEFEGNLTVDPSNMRLGFKNTENHPETDASRRDPWIDVRDTKLDFQLLVPRVASQKVATAVAAIGAAPAFANAAQVLAAYDTVPLDAPPSDYPTTSFVLDLLLTSVVLRPPFLRGAKREANGQLVLDPEREQVKITLPKIKFRLSQGAANTDPIVATLLSAGATGLDDPGDLAVAELITMDPPYAFIGGSQTVGFGFRSGVLDLSEGSTPPDVLAQFGFDESWTGLYLPEIRLFVAPHGARDFAVEGGVENLLIGLGASSGITGDFSLQVLDQGAGPLKMGARFYGPDQRGYGIVRTSDTTATVQLPATSRMVADVEGGRTPITTTITIDGGTAISGREATIDMSSADTRTIVVTSTDTSSPPRTATFTITASRRPAPVEIPGTATPGPQQPVRVVARTATQNGVPVLKPRSEVIGESPVTLALSDVPAARAALTEWTVGGVSKGTSAQLQVDVLAGAPDVVVTAKLPADPSVTSFTGYFRFDLPPYKDSLGRVQTPADTRAFALDPANTHTTTAGDEGPSSGWLGGSDVKSALRPLLEALPDSGSTPLSVKGYASYEGPTPPPATPDASAFAYNKALAGRRALGLQAIIEQLIAEEPSLAAKNIVVSAADDMTNWTSQGYPNVTTRRVWWKATVGLPSAPETLASITLHRDAPESVPGPPTPYDPPPKENAQPAPPPRWFRQMGAKVRIVRDQFVACEVTAKIDIQTAAEDRLAAGMPSGSSGTLPEGQPLGANPGDGLIDLRLVVQIDDATDTVSVIGYYGADPADVDGLYLWGTPPGGTPPDNPGFGLNFLGTTIVFMPLLSATAGAVANDGALAEIAMTAAMLSIPAGIAGLAEVGASPIKVHCERVTWYGGEVQFRNRPGGAEAVILFDLEAALNMNVTIAGKKLIEIKKGSPLSVRYKAVGIRIGNDPDQPRFQFRPVFDASKGYTIDVSKPGAITVASPLDQILTILGARIARNNPLVFEIDLGFAVDLGVVTIERARVRLKFDPLGTPELTAFAAGVDIPGALQGRGYMEMNENEIKGQIDLTIVPVQVRIAAGVGVANIDEGGRKATGVIISLEVEFPVAIPLANSGLGIYGFLGLFAMHYRRKEPASTTMAPALAWLKDVAGGNPMNIAAWEPKIDTWAFGIGAIVGTMGSSVIFNLKGVVLLELPGPRLLLVMRADLLKVMPKLKGTAEGTFLAVIDLDMGRGTLTIGISVEFGITPLFEIRIPVEAFFNFHDRNDWHLYLGRFVDQIHAKVFEIFEGSGYLMLSGKGFTAGQIASNLPVPVAGFAISTGLHVSIVWGSKSVGLYAEVAGGFDAVLGFDPFMLAGMLYIRGTLHLFILDISAWANLTVLVGELPDQSKVSRIEGEICGKVEFLFFSVEGCVEFALGPSSVPTAAIPDLFQSLRLVSRSPALAMGTGVDKPIDGGIAEGIAGDAMPPAPPPPPPPAPIGQPAPEVPMNQRRVPIDAIPLAMLTMPPMLVDATDSTAAEYWFRGAKATVTPGSTGAPADGWVQRGEDVFQYTLKKVELIGELLDGATPAVWWPQKAGDAASAAQLALLSWVPDPTPKALVRSDFLDETITETWGTVCRPAAPATSVFFTFLREPFGPSALGWVIDGEAWPDPAGTVRSQPPVLTMKVTERWRSGSDQVDNLIGVIPAVVEGTSVTCPPRRDRVPPVRGEPAETIRDRILVPPGRGGVPRNEVIDRLERERVLERFDSERVLERIAVNPIAATRGAKRADEFAAEELTLVDVASRLNAGTAVTRANLTRLVTTATTVAGRVNRGAQCTSRVLAAPVLDSRDIQPFGGPERIEPAILARRTRRFRPGPFDDAVVFHTGAIERSTFYLFVRRDLLAERLVVVALTDANDVVLDQILVDSSMAAPPTAFPPRWTDAAGPWYEEAAHVVQHQLALREGGYLGVLVTIKGNAKADRIQVGLQPQSAQWHRGRMHRPYYVAAIEVLTSAEARRFDYDTREQTSKQSVLEAALSDSSSGQALLKPNTAYAVRVDYDVQRGKRPAGQPVGSITTQDDQHQTFWFYTDDEPPRRLDPWVMCSTPEDGEQHYFGEMPIHVAFNSPDVGRIYDAYGKRLQVRLRSASFRPLPSTSAVPHPFPLTPSALKPIKASILSPWEAAAVEQLTGTCVPVSGERVRHVTTTVPIPLEPFTDYVLDIEMADKAAPEAAAGTVVWRTGFSTGRFPTIAELAKSFQLNRVLHRFSKPGALQAIGTQPWAADPQGNQLDAAMIAAGLEPMGVPTAAGVIVFWEAGATAPQPAAVLVDSSAPMWRSRRVPVEVAVPTPPHLKQYEMQTLAWLRMGEESGGDAIVDKVVQAPGGQRALITLKPNARGKTLRLALTKVAMTQPFLDGPSAVNETFTIVDTRLTSAPWEEDD